MTATDIDAFAECYDKLARTQGGKSDSDTMHAYFEALKDLPLEAVEGAARQLARTGGDYFPRAGTWHEAAQRHLPPPAPWWDLCHHEPSCEKLIWHQLKLAKEAQGNAPERNA